MGTESSRYTCRESTFCPGCVTQLVGCCLMHQKVAGWIPGQTYAQVVGSIPGIGRARSSRSMFPFHIHVSLSVSKKIYLSIFFQARFFKRHNLVTYSGGGGLASHYPFHGKDVKRRLWTWVLALPLPGCVTSLSSPFLISKTWITMGHTSQVCFDD